MPCHQERAKSCAHSTKGASCTSVLVALPGLSSVFEDSPKSVDNNIFSWIEIWLANDNSREDLCLSCRGLYVILHVREDACLGRVDGALGIFFGLSPFLWAEVDLKLWCLRRIFLSLPYSVRLWILVSSHPSQV